MTINYRGIEIPTTARDWQLFTNKKASKAAKELTAALKTAFLTFSFNARQEEDVEEALVSAGRVLAPVMKRYENLGAYDTEARGLAVTALMNYAKLTMYGIAPEYTYSAVPTGSRWDEETFKLWDAAQKGMTTR